MLITKSLAEVYTCLGLYCVPKQLSQNKVQVRLLEHEVMYVLWPANKKVLKRVQMSGQILVGSVLMWVGVYEMVYGSDKVVEFVLGERNPAVPGKEA